MQTRDNLRNTIKSLGLTVFKRVGPYLVLGGVATNLYILFAPKEMQEEQTCENARGKLGDNPSILQILNSVFIADTGIYIFNITGVIRAVVIPTMHWAHTKVAECLDSAPLLQDHHIEAIKVHEDELINTLSTGIFIKSLPIESAASYAMLPMAAMPLIRLILKHRLSRYPGSASLPIYREIYPEQPKLVLFLAILESVWSGINLGVSFNAMTDLGMNVFYNSTHEDDWKYQNELMYATTALGFVGGVLSIFNNRSHQLSNHASNTMQFFYLISMPLLSLVMCFDPTLENIDTFMNRAIYLVLFVMTGSFIFAEGYTRLTSERAQDNSNADLDNLPRVSNHSIFSVNDHAEESENDLEVSSEADVKEEGNDYDGDEDVVSMSSQPELNDASPNSTKLGGK